MQLINKVQILYLMILLSIWILDIKDHLLRYIQN